MGTENKETQKSWKIKAHEKSIKIKALEKEKKRLQHQSQSYRATNKELRLVIPACVGCDFRFTTNH
jgi:predicted Zn-ribbon and HTH transcriptional regulator